MTNSFKKKISYILVCILFGSMFTGLNSVTVTASTETDEYVVIVENQETALDIVEEYNIDDSNNDNTEQQNQENMPIVLEADLSKLEATQIEKEIGIKCVEKDLMITKEEVNELDIENITKPTSDTWNFDIINTESSYGENKIKVAIIDSGIDLSENVQVKERKNFIPGEFNALFEDTCGHGTSVASIIAGQGIDSDVEGVNRNVELYSARVLDNNKQAPISRVVEAIYWAIEKNVDIINMSFGTENYSEALEIAVKDANKSGILVVASAGNRGSNTVEYPAAFDSVISVGSIDANGDISEFSSRGEAVDIFAPGEAVIAQSNFGEDLVLSGTSLAAPHITGIASLLWSKDVNKSPLFIKTLIERSTISINDSYNVVDYKYAEDVYDELAMQLGASAFRDANGDKIDEVTSLQQELSSKDDLIEGCDEEGNTVEIKTDMNLEAISIPENVNEIDEYGTSKVEAAWGKSVHKENIENKKMKDGAVYQDEEASLSGMTSHPEYHGYSWKDGENAVYGNGTSNYVANYNYLVRVANAYRNGNTYTAIAKSNVKGLTTADYNALKAGFENKIHPYMVKEKYTNTQKRAFVLGMAAHVATDAFAHSAFTRASAKSNWSRIKHPNADDVTFRPGRYKMALIIEKNVVNRYKGNRVDIPICHDFHDGTGDFYDGVYSFRINKLVTFSEAAGVTNATVLKHYKEIGN